MIDRCSSSSDHLPEWRPKDREDIKVRKSGGHNNFQLMAVPKEKKKEIVRKNEIIVNKRKEK